MAEPIVARMVRFEMPTDLECAYIYPIGDLHLGDPACDIAKVYDYLEWVKKRDNAYILLNGDLANVAIRNSVSDVHQEEFPVNEQAKRLVAMFEPYADRIIAITGGNHEWRIQHHTGFDLNEHIAVMLGIPERYHPDEVYIKVSVGVYATHGESQRPVVYSIYMTHGARGGRKSGATANQLEDLSMVCDADIYVSGHTHKKMAFPLGFHRLDVNHGTVRAAKHLFVSTGAYLKREGYPVRKGYPPTWPGSPRIRLDGTRKDCHASV